MTGTRTRWRVEILVMPKSGVNDPEGAAILGGLRSLGYLDVARVASGRRFEVDLDAVDAAEAANLGTSMADRLLANPVIEEFSIGAIEELSV